MTKRLRILFFSVLILGVGLNSVIAQRNIDPAIDRDPLLETDAKHNLDVAWQAFKPLKKAYKQVILRFEETFAAYPEFSKMDEVLYLALDLADVVDLGAASHLHRARRKRPPESRTRSGRTMRSARAD